MQLRNFLVITTLFTLCSSGFCAEAKSLPSPKTFKNERKMELLDSGDRFNKVNKNFIERLGVASLSDKGTSYVFCNEDQRIYDINTINLKDSCFVSNSLSAGIYDGQLSVVRSTDSKLLNDKINIKVSFIQDKICKLSLYSDANAKKLEGELFYDISDTTRFYLDKNLTKVAYKSTNIK